MDINLQIALKTLKKRFPGDPAAQKALLLLENKINTQSSTIYLDPSEEEPFPLPPEIKVKEKAFALFSDGACRGNPGPGAWAAMGQDQTGKLLFEIYGVEEKTTNNQMELQGPIEALIELKKNFAAYHFSPDCEIYLFSDSKYVVEGMELWVSKWKKKGWKKSDNKIPENLSKWQQLEELREGFPHIHFIWVKGHAGHPQNERCDQLANSALDNFVLTNS